jgi:acetylornithine aminotransferase
MIVDEVQSGIGRTGSWFSSTAAGVVPDVMTLAKGLAGGMPLGAVIVTGSARDALRPGDHGTTFGGNPVSCAAALAVIDTIERQNLLGNAQHMGEVLRDGIAALGSPRIAEVRGAGLWIGIVLTQPIASEIELALRSAGFLVNAAKPDALRLAPPLIVEAGHVAHFLAALKTVLMEVP